MRPAILSPVLTRRGSNGEGVQQAIIARSLSESSIKKAESARTTAVVSGPLALEDRLFMLELQVAGEGRAFSRNGKCGVHRLLNTRRLGLHEIPAMMALQQQVVMGLPDPHLFIPIDEEFVVKHLRDAGAAFGVSDGDQLIAYGLLVVPASDKSLSRDLPHCEIDPQDVAHMESCVVHPAYRGLGIQRQLTQLRLQFAMETGIGHVLMTISPKNFHSLHNQINRHGFKVRNLKLKYSGVWRFILHRKVQTAEQSLIPDEWCPVDDIDRLQRIFSSGLVGVAIQLNGGSPQLGYTSERRMAD